MKHSQQFSLKNVIDYEPLTVSPKTSLLEVLALMSQAWADSCLLSAVSADVLAAPERNSCALVVTDEKLLGIFTERDLVKLAATGRELTGVTVAEVMSRQLVTLTQPLCTESA